ncbi:MAG: hypothetical protein ACE5G1_16410 [bacterium]
MKTNLRTADDFAFRHIGPTPIDQEQMLGSIGVGSLEELIDQTIPEDIRLQAPIDFPAGISEYQLLDHLRDVAKKNKLFKSFIGLGYYDCIVPAVILRNIFENPGWYKQYKPYQ